MHGIVEHIANAKHNRSAVDVLSGHGLQYADWVIVLYYYEVIHLVEAALDARGTHSNNHLDRKQNLEAAFGRNWRLEYERLEIATRELRYECRLPNKHYLQQIVTRTVAPFVDHFCRLLGPHDPTKMLKQELAPRS